MSESCNELIISAEELARIRTACQRRAAELETPRTPQRLPAAPGLSQSTNGKFANLTGLTEAERFVAAVSEMPTDVGCFFEYEEPIVSPRQLESAQDRLERQARAGFGGWCG